MHSLKSLAVSLISILRASCPSRYDNWAETTGAIWWFFSPRWKIQGRDCEFLFLAEEWCFWRSLVILSWSPRTCACWSTGGVHAIRLGRWRRRRAVAVGPRGLRDVVSPWRGRGTTASVQGCVFCHGEGRRVDCVRWRDYCPGTWICRLWGRPVGWQGGLMRLAASTEGLRRRLFSTHHVC